MIGLLAIVGVVSLLLLWVMETGPVEPHGLDSFDVPPPVPCSCPVGHLTGDFLVGRVPHVEPCAFARIPT